MLLTLLGAFWLSALASASYQPPIGGAAALVSRTSKTLYLVYPAGDSSTYPRFYSLPLDQPFSTGNFTRGRKELPSLPSPSRDLSITPVLIPGADRVKELRLEKTLDELYVLAGEKSKPAALFKYDETLSVDWIQVELSASTTQHDGQISETSPLPPGRSLGAGFAYAHTSTTSAIAPKNTYMATDSRSNDPALDAYERGDVIAEGVAIELFHFGGMTTGPNDSNNYTSSLLTVQLPVEHRLGYAKGQSNKTTRSEMESESEPAAAVVTEHDGKDQTLWPIPQGEFTMTYVPGENGEARVVMMGGVAANWSFVDLSQIAVFRLPTQEWEFKQTKPPPNGTFLPPDGDNLIPIDTRAGHTAVASADGKKIIVYGGYISKPTNPSMPQMLVLDLETASWSIPSAKNQQHGPPANSSLFGHGAAVMGDYMLLTGGTVSTVGSSEMQANTATYLYDVKNNAWLLNYDPAKAGLATLPTTNHKKRKTAAAVGVGVSFGILGLIGIAGVCIWYSKRRKRQALPSEEAPVEKSSQSPETSQHDSGVSNGSNHSRSTLGLHQMPAPEDIPPVPEMHQDAPRLKSLDPSTTRSVFSPILEGEENSPPPVPPLPPLPRTPSSFYRDRDPVEVMRHEYGVAREMTHITDAMERARSTRGSINEHQDELHIPVERVLSAPVNAEWAPRGTEKHLSSYVRSLPASLRIVPPSKADSPTPSVISIPWSISPKSKGKGKGKERRHSFADSLRSVLSPASNRSMNTPSPVSPLSASSTQDVPSSTSSQHYRGSGVGDVTGSSSFDREDAAWDPVSGDTQSVVQVMFTAPKGQLRVVNLDELKDEDEETKLDKVLGEHKKLEAKLVEEEKEETTESAEKDIETAPQPANEPPKKDQIQEDGDHQAVDREYDSEEESAYDTAEESNNVIIV